jgi:hypothetical protein
MKCHAGVEFLNGAPCPKCHANLGEVCWPGINADLLELARLREAKPIAWIVTYDMKQSGSQASAYVKEDEARRAALNVEKYADASNVKVMPAYSLPSQDRA